MKKNLLITIIASFSILILQAQEFKSIDNYASQTPKKMAHDVSTLAKYLTAQAKTETQKVRAFYYWITNNVVYDTQQFFSNKVPTKQIEGIDVLKKQKAVCQGYSQLFKEMCDATRITCYIVSGYSKGYGWNSKRKLIKSDHAWNIVKIDSNWYQIDVTWGSGYLNEKNKFVSEFSEDFFFTNPKTFIYKHLSEVPMWQLLDCPINIETYIKDSNAIKMFIQQSAKCFSYKDSIEYFESLGAIDAKIYLAKSAYNYNNYASAQVGFAYMEKAYQLSQILLQGKPMEHPAKSKTAQEEILKHYETAKKYFLKSKDPSAKQALGICKNNISAGKENLDVFKKLMER